MPTEADFAAVEAAGSAFPFDLFGALRFWLTDQGHPATATDHWDRHDRLLAAASVQAQKGLLETPVVNGYLQLFRAWLGARTDLPVKTHRATVVLTHDVDDPVDPGDVGHALWVMGAATLKRRPRAALGVGQGEAASTASRTSLPWRRSTGVGVPSILRRRSGGGRGRPNGTSLTMCGAPPFALPSTIFETGAEVGLHLSYRAGMISITEGRESPARLGGPVIGGRHHYWHMHKPFWRTLRDHGRAGLRYDTPSDSTTPQAIVVALPFRPFDPQNDALIDVVQIPTSDGWESSLRQTVSGCPGTHRRLLDRLKTYEDGSH